MTSLGLALRSLGEFTIDETVNLANRSHQSQGPPTCPATHLSQGEDRSLLGRQGLPGLESHSAAHRHPCRGFRDF